MDLILYRERQKSNINNNNNSRSIYIIVSARRKIKQGEKIATGLLEEIDLK